MELNNTIILDGQHKTTFREFLHANTEQDGMIESADIISLLSMNQGEKIFIGIVEIHYPIQ